MEEREGRPAPGGTCTNVGCISKALLQSSEHFEHANHHFGTGISAKGHQDRCGQDDRPQRCVVKQNNDGILYLFKKNKVSFFHGRGSFVKAAGRRL